MKGIGQQVRRKGWATVVLMWSAPFIVVHFFSTVLINIFTLEHFICLIHRLPSEIIPA